MTNKVTAIDKISMIVLLLAPILWIYGNPGGWSYEVIFTLPLSFFYFLHYLFSKGNITGSKDPLPKGLLWYFIYWTVLFVLTAMQLPLSMIQTYLAFFLFFATFRDEYFIKIYKAFALICIVFFFVQEASFYLTGIRVSGIMRFLPLHGEMSMSEKVGMLAESLRSSSFFSEPAHFAQFLLPLFALEIFYDKHKTHILFAVSIGAALLFLRSGNGLLGMAAILVFLIPYYLGRGRKNRILTFVVAALFIGVVAYYYVNSEMGASLLERQDEISMDYEGGSRSGFLRMWRGLFVFEDYSVVEKLVGCPNETTQLSHVASSGMLMVDTAELYFNAFWKILLNTGFIGLGIFIYIIVGLWRGNNVCGKAILASLIALSLIAGIYMSHTMILFLVLAKSMKSAPEGAVISIKRKKQIEAVV